jgi:predicted MFS family arabinose efflux permease
MGVGAAILTPITAAIIPTMFPPAERPKAIALLAIGLGAGIPLGPIVGGYLLEHFWWGAVFLVNLPVVVVAMVAVAVLIPESKDPTPRPVDLLGGLLSTAGLVAFVYAVISAPEHGWTSARVLVAAIGGLALLSAFVGRERRAAEPMIDLRLLGRPRFLWGSIAGTIASFGLFGLLFVLPLYLQAVQGYNAIDTGVRLLPMMGGLVVGARASEKIGAKAGARPPIVGGLVLITAGLAAGTLTTVDSGYALVAGRLAADAGLPAADADAARDSVAGAVAVAARLGDTALAADARAADARAAFMPAMAAALLGCAVVTASGAFGALLGLKGTTTPAAAAADQPVHTAA